MASITKTSKTSKTSKISKVTKTAKSNVIKPTKSVEPEPVIEVTYPTYDFSIYILSIFNNLEEQVVIDTFNALFGTECVEKVDFWVPPTAPKNAKFKMAFVHFNNMPETELANNFKESIGEGKEIRIHYTEKYFWKCLMNKKANKPAPSAEEKEKFVPKMIIGAAVPTATPNDKNKSWGDIEEEEENKSAAESDDEISDEEE